MLTSIRNSQWFPTPPSSRICRGKISATAEFFIFFTSFKCLVFCPPVLNDKCISILKRNSSENPFHRRAIKKQFLHHGEIPLSIIQQAALLHSSFFVFMLWLSSIFLFFSKSAGEIHPFLRVSLSH